MCVYAVCVRCVCVCVCVCVCLCTRVRLCGAGLAWDCGALATGPVTVPVLLALGIGVMKSAKEERQRLAAEEARLRGRYCVCTSPVYTLLCAVAASCTFVQTHLACAKEMVAAEAQVHALCLCARMFVGMHPIYAIVSVSARCVCVFVCVCVCVRVCACVSMGNTSSIFQMAS